MASSEMRLQKFGTDLNYGNLGWIVEAYFIFSYQKEIKRAWLKN